MAWPCPALVLFVAEWTALVAAFATCFNALITIISFITLESPAIPCRISRNTISKQQSSTNVKPTELPWNFQQSENQHPRHIKISPLRFAQTCNVWNIVRKIGFNETLQTSILNYNFTTIIKCPSAYSIY